MTCIKIRFYYQTVTAYRLYFGFHGDIFIYCQRESIIIWEYSKKTYFQVFKWAEVNENEWESVGLKRELWKSMK